MHEGSTNSDTDRKIGTRRVFFEHLLQLMQDKRPQISNFDVLVFDLLEIRPQLIEINFA